MIPPKRDRLNDTDHSIYGYLVALYGFDPLAEAALIAEAEALLVGGAK